ncbi:unnamed protein product [Periconia digitata]|uniref:Uncharacterized protein n=1 Tax=Periconia digitata TaxID=1303443 RepID=A0A9W4U3I9_9PLEO|nr:unnamed protein product [Periconia digitata]
MTTSFFQSTIAHAHKKRFQRSATGPHLSVPSSPLRLSSSSSDHYDSAASTPATCYTPPPSLPPSSSHSNSTMPATISAFPIPPQTIHSVTTTTTTPRPNHTYTIISRSTSLALTFLNGCITLVPPGSLGTYRWRCVETPDGWLGFQDPASGMYLGYDDHAWLQCTARKHGEREWVCPRERPSGGWVLLVVLEGGCALPIGVRRREGDVGVKIRRWNSGGITWDFMQV